MRRCEADKRSSGSSPKVRYQAKPSGASKRRVNSSPSSPKGFIKESGLETDRYKYSGIEVTCMK
jgi:hypothetical protein